MILNITAIGVTYSLVFPLDFPLAVIWSPWCQAYCANYLIIYYHIVGVSLKWRLKVLCLLYHHQHLLYQYRDFSFIYSDLFYTMELVTSPVDIKHKKDKCNKLIDICHAFDGSPKSAPLTIYVWQFSCHGWSSVPCMVATDGYPGLSMALWAVPFCHRRFPDAKTIQVNCCEGTEYVEVKISFKS